MNVVNAIAKVRFSAARPQRIQLHRTPTLAAELLCMDPGQSIEARPGQWCYYMLTGAADLDGADEQAATLSTGQLATFEPGRPHTLTAAGEDRLICLAIGRTA